NSTMPLRSFGPRSSTSNRMPRSFLVSSAMMTVFSSAIPYKCSPEPKSQCRHGSGGPRGSPGYLQQRPIPALPHRALGIILMGLGVAKIDEHAAALLAGRNDFAQV